MTRPVHTIYDATSQGVICAGSIFYNISATIAEDEFKLDLDDFISLLRNLHRRVLLRKEASKLLSPAIFKAGRRGKDHVLAANGLWLDNDSGHPSPQEFAHIFPNLRIVAFSTFSASIEVPKYRVFIPTAEWMEANVYSALWREMTRRVTLTRPDHGFDAAPCHSAAMFYLPCRRAEGLAFFHDFKGGARQPLKVRQWLRERPQEPPRIVRPQPSTIALDQNRIEQALERISPDCDRATWFRCLCALHHGLGEAGFDVADRWSRGSSSKYDPRDIKQQWNSISRRKHARPITINTLFYIANQKDK